jgi:hypothetical protein
LTKPAADMVAQALNMIERGDLTLEKGPEVFGEAWDLVYPAVKIALKVNLASQPPVISSRPFQPLDLSSGWHSLQSQLETTPQLAASPQPARPAQPVFEWWAWLLRFFQSRPGQALGGSLVGLVLVFVLALGVAESQPGDPLYRARLGWEYLGEFVELNPDQKALVALRSADNRLAELENMAFAAKPDQLLEVQGQYLRALDASARYSANPLFHSYLALYEQLNVQRDRVTRLQLAEYSFGPGARLQYLAGRLDDAVYIIAPRIPGYSPPAPEVTPNPATPPPIPVR